MEAGSSRFGHFPPRPTSARADGVGGRADPILAVSEGGTNGSYCRVSCGVEAKRGVTLLFSGEQLDRWSCFYLRQRNWRKEGEQGPGSCSAGFLPDIEM